MLVREQITEREKEREEREERQRKREKEGRKKGWKVPIKNKTKERKRKRRREKKTNAEKSEREKERKRETECVAVLWAIQTVLVLTLQERNTYTAPPLPTSRFVGGWAVEIKRERAREERESFLQRMLRAALALVLIWYSGHL